MAVTAEICPSCGAPLTLDGTRCAFCHVPLVVSQTGSVSQAVPGVDPDPDAPFAMQIEDVFVIGGKPIATGKVASGVLNVGDRVTIEGPGKPVTATCTKIEMFRKQMDRAVAGNNVGLVLDKVDAKHVVKSAWLRPG
ncbi:MAG TPA: EF-Tu/IF-2/RF-3 family GTPase [Ilumatobacteraceae bacterium]